MGRVYLGEPGHFIGAASCVFHLTTRVNGKWLVSTVGDYRPRGVDGTEPMEIGYKRLYETMVFELDASAEIISVGDPHDFKAYNDAASANLGHEALVQKFEAL